MREFFVIWGEESHNVMSEDIIELACDGDRWMKTFEEPEAFRQTCNIVVNKY
jgi:hypothetical protein